MAWIIETTEDRDYAISIYSDIYKDTYGFRPRGYLAYLNSLSNEKLAKVMNELQSDLETEIDREAQEKLDAIKSFETLIENYMNDFGIDRQTAIRWDMQSLGITTEEIKFYGMDVYAYKHNLPFGYFKYAVAG